MQAMGSTIKTWHIYDYLIFNLDGQKCFKVMIDTFSVPITSCVISLPFHILLSNAKNEGKKGEKKACGLQLVSVGYWGTLNEGNDY